LFGWLSKQDTLLLEVMKEILETQRVWTQQMLQMEQERLRLEGLRLEGARPLSDVPMGKMFINEDEQDLDWALKTGLIAPDEYKMLLSSTGVDATDIEFL